MKVVCFGDSNTYGFDPCSMFGGCYPADCRWVDIVAAKTGWEFKNQGLNGREIPYGTIMIPKNTDLLIVMLGGNDILQGGGVNSITQCMESFLSGLQIEKNKILLIAPPPMQLGDWVPNKELIDVSVRLIPSYEALAKRLGVQFIDSSLWQIELAQDGVHFTRAGHKKFAEGLYNYLTKGE